jgi:hypothetical protein
MSQQCQTFGFRKELAMATTRHRPASGGARRKARRWSQHVTETSDAMDLKHDIFKSGTAEEVAASLKNSATHSRRRKGTPFQSAMSMLNFYINRAGRNLPRERLATLRRAKGKLREAFGRTA